MFDLSFAVASVSNVVIAVKRPADTYDGNGTAARTFTAIASNKRASCQPLEGAQLQKLPEGERVTDWQTLYSSVQLIVGDVVTITGKGDFQVRDLGAWNDTGNFGKSHIRKMANQEPRA